MTHDPVASDEAQFIVIPTQRGSSSLTELCQIAPSRQVEIVRIVGPTERPVRLVLRGPRARIAELHEQFSNELLFEEDRSLSLT